MVNQAEKFNNWLVIIEKSEEGTITFILFTTLFHLINFPCCSSLFLTLNYFASIHTHIYTHTPCLFMHCFLVISLLFCFDDETLGVGNSGNNNSHSDFRTRHAHRMICFHFYILVS